jgi:hypothetical protein
MLTLTLSGLGGLLLIQIATIVLVIRVMRRAKPRPAPESQQSTVIQSYVLNTDRKLDQVVQNAMDAMLRQTELASDLPKPDAPWHA